MLDWNDNPAAENVTSYNVYRTGTTSVWASVTSSQFTNAGQVTNGNQYCYQLTAVNAAGQSAKTAAVCATPRAGTQAAPSVPTGLTATPGDGRVMLDWNDNPAAENVTSYNVYRTGTTSVWASVTSSQFTNAGQVTNGNQYCYQLTAVNAAGQSAKTAAVCATPRAGT